MPVSAACLPPDRLSWRTELQCCCFIKHNDQGCKRLAIGTWGLHQHFSQACFGACPLVICGTRIDLTPGWCRNCSNVFCDQTHWLSQKSICIYKFTNCTYKGLRRSIQLCVWKITRHVNATFLELFLLVILKVAGISYMYSQG